MKECFNLAAATVSTISVALGFVTLGIGLATNDTNLIGAASNMLMTGGAGMFIFNPFTSNNTQPESEPQIQTSQAKPPTLS